MQQVTQRLRDGVVEVLDVPEPVLTPETVLVDVRASLLSVGTERAKIEAGKKSLIGKARARPDQVAQVIDKARNDGLLETVRAVRMRLDQRSAIGYSAAGVVLEVGTRVGGLTPGDRVACGGGEHAVHADIVRVPGNLCVRLPTSVDFDGGAFTTVGSVAMHGVRQADVRLGERVAVIGLGLVGQLTAQVLRAAGCHVVGIDLAPDLVERSISLHAVDAAYTRSALNGHGLPPDAVNCDAVIITAAARSSDPIELAARLCRDRGRVVVVGDVTVDIPRASYYERELELRLSRSYGPGRYDRAYEERGLDYPIGYVRWTEQRNMAAFVDLLAKGRIDVDGLIVERVSIDRAPKAYERLLTDVGSPLGIVLQYAEPQRERRRAPLVATGLDGVESWSVVNVIGTGSFAQRILIPGLSRAGFELRSAASARGLSAQTVVDRFGFARAVTPQEAIEDSAAGLVAISTRHSSHAELAATALRAGKAVFVEKPPCLTEDELATLSDARAYSSRPLFVGFNRRFAPLAQPLRDHVQTPGAPIEVLFRVNAGPLPPDHWLNDPEDGGGRLLGEGCHFIDFACWLVDAPISHVHCSMRVRHESPLTSAQGFSAILDFTNGSSATIHYTAQGASSLQKEYVEAHSSGRTGILNDFRSLTLIDGRRSRDKRTRSQDKGHLAQLVHLYKVLSGDAFALGPDPLDSMGVALLSLASAQSGRGVPV